MAANELGAAPLTKSAENVESFQWSPDGKAIAYLALAARTDGDSISGKTDDEPVEVGLRLAGIVIDSAFGRSYS